MMRNDIILISYITGTGGNFLKAWLTDAKYNRHNPIPFSRYGNTHAYVEDLAVLSFNMKDSDDIKMEAILSQRPELKSFPPYFAQSHIRNINNATAKIKQNIRITYVKEDIPDICCIYLGKALHDNTKEFSNIISDKKLLQDKYKGFTMRANMHLNSFSHGNVENVLYVSYRDMLYLNELTFTSNFSNFVNIPVENFNLDNLKKWRELTFDCIKDIKNRLN